MNDQGSKVLNLLQGKLKPLFRLINKIRSLDEFVIYINGEKGKFKSLLRDLDKEIEEAELRRMLKSSPYFVEKIKGNFTLIIGYEADNTSELFDIEEIDGICIELVEIIMEEALELHNKILAEKNMIELMEKSQLDGLTGLYNRCAFDQMYRKIYQESKEGNRDFSVLMVDLDNFKKVNDSYGHQMGDKILKQVAHRIKSNVRKDDIVARYGGEEIIIILVDIDEGEAIIIAERIRDSIATLKTEGVQVTISIGISNLKKDETKDSDMLIYIADQRLYEAKEQGKNKVRGKRRGK